MTKEEIFALWAPDHSPWSPWVKPVLFAHLDLVTFPVSAPEPTGDVSWAPSPTDKVALVLDLPCSEGVIIGLALAGRGYRPLPLYNALPLPSINPLVDDLPLVETAAVNVLPILEALKNGANSLAQSNLPLDAPPAFLLDANRRGPARKIEPGEFDNRSLSFTTDFPSANFLLAHGVQRVLLIQKDRVEPQPDLIHSLRRWQDGGLRLERLRLDLPASFGSFTVPRPSWYGAMFQRAFFNLGLSRASDGGFGAWVPDSSSGG